MESNSIELVIDREQCITQTICFRHVSKDPGADRIYL